MCREAFASIPFIRGFMSETAVVAAKGAWKGATSMGLQLLPPLLPPLLLLLAPLLWRKFIERQQLDFDVQWKQRYCEERRS